MSHNNSEDVLPKVLAEAVSVIREKHFKLFKVSAGNTYVNAVAFDEEDAKRAVRAWLTDWPYDVGNNVWRIEQEYDLIVSKRIDPESRLY